MLQETRARAWLTLAATIIALAGFSPAALAQDDTAAEEAASEEVSVDRHIGYYYPEPQSQETYVARARPLPDSDRQRRLAFVTLLATQQLQAPYSPGLAIFAKGEEAEKLIMVALKDELFDSVFRMRGVLAMMTASARSSELFRSYNVQDIFTFFDLLKLMGFEKVTLTDGRDLAHVVYLE
ncbi:MAG: molybdopterin-guanine dinucleotide biosynthesis protein A [Alphaproteobacteria bacterium]|nr:molybdopterin-guanine dinucleotide biosynthesis protein A [Rhodospirillaceae bacterium]MBT6205007.1 molybdopterin-guanine dinucleotide biosynthesis protein A [Rhodospirillaceae bacterium]MDG2481057.1 molybdopterin-guanine dinucleotide biosynthesis protein A [Alphaproteobacteria bacterium]